MVSAVEINSETDFVARNPQFQELISAAAKSIVDLHGSSAGSGAGWSTTATGSLTVPREAALDAPSGSSSVGASVADLAGTVRENVSFRRAEVLPVPSDGVVGTYVHASATPGGPSGRIAAAVALAARGPAVEAARAADPAALATAVRASLEPAAQQLAMHVAAAFPRYLRRADVPPEALAAERELLTQQAASSGKPAKIVAKMVEGRLNKFYGDVCLEEQTFVVDDSKRVRDVAKDAAADLAKALGAAPKDATVDLEGFVRLQVGEGIEAAEEADFAAEVEKTIRETSA